jgi:hypothetical protein
MIIMLVLCLLSIVLLFALHRKGDVKAGVKILGLTFSLEARDRRESCQKSVSTRPALTLIPPPGRNDQ